VKIVKITTIRRITRIKGKSQELKENHKNYNKNYKIKRRITITKKELQE